MFKKSSIKTLIRFISGSIFIFPVLIIAAQGHTSTSVAPSLSSFQFKNEFVIMCIISQTPAESNDVGKETLS